MTLRAVFEDRLVVEAQSFDDLVTQLKLDMWVVPKTRQEYMNGVRDRCEVYNGNRIQYHDAESFIYELCRVGVITDLVQIIDPPPCSFCENRAVYDAKTDLGPWAFMCDDHYLMHGIGLGLGRGQQLKHRVSQLFRKE